MSKNRPFLDNGDFNNFLDQLNDNDKFDHILGDKEIPSPKPKKPRRKSITDEEVEFFNEIFKG